MLGHAGSTITSRYVHHLDAVLIAAADHIAGTILPQMTGKAAEPSQKPARRARRTSAPEHIFSFQRCSRCNYPAFWRLTKSANNGTVKSK